MPLWSVSASGVPEKVVAAPGGGRDEALGEVLGEGWISRGEFLDDGTSVGADQREVFPVLAEAEVGVQFGARDGVVLVGGKYYEITARRVGGTSPDTGCRNAPASTSRSTELSREPRSVPRRQGRGKE